MIATLLIDVFSVFGGQKKKPLGKKGEKVAIISDHNGVLIVEGLTRFTVSQNEVSYERERTN